jgi:hypothetical protein
MNEWGGERTESEIQISDPSTKVIYNYKGDYIGFDQR